MRTKATAKQHDLNKRRKQRTWDEWYSDAREYSRVYGNLLVPRTFRTLEGDRLGRWIEAQRACYNNVPSAKTKLSQLQIALLEQIGMVWKMEYRSEWAAWLEQLRKYYVEHGDLLVPVQYKSGIYSLGHWIQQRRKQYAQGTLSAEQIADLEACGMVWRVGTKRREWEDWLADARAYYSEHGDLAVPTGYETAEGNKLGVWLETQRRRGKRLDRQRLTEDQIRQLDALGMIWDYRDVREEAWERMYGWVADYRRTHGKLPATWEIAAPDGRKMYTWIQTQKESMAEGTASPQRIKKLEALGICAPKQKKMLRENIASMEPALPEQAAVRWA